MAPPLLYRLLNRWRRWREDRHVPDGMYLQQIRALYRREVEEKDKEFGARGQISLRQLTDRDYRVHQLR